MVAEGLLGLMHNVVSLVEFQGFKLSETNSYELLQFANDILLICDGSWRNLWSIKVILRGFGLVFGLCVNLFKSKIYGFNMNQGFI